MIETPAEILAHHATRQAADSFIAFRKRLRKPLTETGAIRLAKTLAAINAAGGDASDALGMAEEHGWQTIKPEWYQKVTNGNGNRTGGHTRPDATIDVIHVAARSGRTPGSDLF